MTDRWLKLLGATIILAVIWGVAPAQQPKELAGEDPTTVETLGKRLTAVEKAVAEMAKAEAIATPMAVSARLDRIENRITRLETENTRYRPGAPAVGSLSLLESRLRSLESEVARLRR